MRTLQVLILPLLILLAKTTIAEEAYPSLLNVEIGKSFAHPSATENKDERRPTTQFRVPNYGPTKGIFSEYQVAILNSSDVVSIITAEITKPDLATCESTKTYIQTLVADTLPNHKLAPESLSPLGGSGEYVSQTDNTYYVLNCQRSYGPFWTLHLQFRGLKEDSQLKAAWDGFFNKS